MYHLHFSKEEIDNCELTELGWIHDWLANQKKSEEDQLKKSLGK